MISKSVLIIPFGLAKAKSRQAESHMSYPVCTIIVQVRLEHYHITLCPMIVHKGYESCDSACLDLAFAKPNGLINTDLPIIS